MAIRNTTNTKVAVLATCLAAVALAYAGAVAGHQAERRHIDGRHAHAGTSGSGAALPSPAPLPAPAGRDATPAHAGGRGDDGAAGGVGALPQPAPVAAPLPVAVDDGRAVDLPRIVLDKFPPKGTVTITYSVARGSFPGLHTQLHQVLATSRLVEGIPVMVVQTDPRPPPTWILVHLIGSTPKETATLAVRNDNVYVAGFCNAAGAWFAFPRFQRQIEGSVALAKKESYGSLIGGHDNLVSLDIGKDAALRAVQFLAAYKLADNNKDTLGTSLATVIVMVAEAARFSRIYDTVVDAQQNQQARLAVADANSVVLWGDLTRAIIYFNETAKWNQVSKFEGAGVNNAKDAIGRLKLLIRPKEFKPSAYGNNTSD